MENAVFVLKNKSPVKIGGLLSLLECGNPESLPGIRQPIDTECLMPLQDIIVNISCNK